MSSNLYVTEKHREKVKIKQQSMQTNCGYLLKPEFPGTEFMGHSWEWHCIA